MRSTRNLLGALRVAASWLLVVAVFFGPAGFGGSAAVAATSKTCGSSCPCDAAVHEDHGSGHEECAEGDRCNEEASASSEDCPDDCPDCACCLGVAMAVLSLPATSKAMSCAAERVLAPIEAPAFDACVDVFRPPRSLI